MLAGVTALLSPGLLRLRTGVGYAALLGADHPVVRELDAFVAEFGGGLPMMAVWVCGEGTPCRDALDRASLRMAEDVARRLGTVPGVLRVESPATTPLLVPAPIGFPEVRRLAPELDGAESFARLRSLALSDPFWRGEVVSSDGKAGAIVVVLASSESEVADRVFRALQEAVRPYEQKGFRFAFAGGPVEFVVAAAELSESTRRIVPSMVGIVGIVLGVVFGSVRLALVALGVVGLGVLWTFGAMGWLGWPRTTLTEPLPALLLVIGVCDTVHLLARAKANSSLAPPSAVGRATDELAAPCWMTSLTTALGFGSLATSRLEGIAHFGVLAAAGTAFSYLLTFTLLPLVLLRFPTLLARSGSGDLWHGLSAALERFLGRFRLVVVAVLGSAVALSVLELGNLRTEARFEDLYGEGSPVVTWARTVARVLRAPDTLEIALRPPAPGEWAEGMRTLRVLRERLSGLEGFGRSRSLLDLLEHLRDAIPGARLSPEEPGERGGAASLVRLLRSREPEAVDLFLSAETGALRITVEAEKVPQEELEATLARVREEIRAALPPGWSFTVTGPWAVVAAMLDEIRRTQLESFLVAGGCVFLALVVFFRSLGTAILAMLPTLAPVLLVLGGMARWEIPLDVGSAMVAAVVLGLAVDGPIHVLSAYRAVGFSRSAVRAALERTGPPLMASGVALGLGFLTLLLSPWHSVARFGVVAAAAIGLSVFTSLVLLPALLVPGVGRGEGGNEGHG